MFTLNEPVPPRTQAALCGLPPRAGWDSRPGTFVKCSAPPDIGFFEVHAENYMVDGGPFHHFSG
jgi:hypothetical protein